MLETDNKTINKIVKELENTSELLEDILVEYEDEGYNIEELEDEIYQKLFICNHCGTWVSVKKEINGFCKSCMKEVESYDD